MSLRLIFVVDSARSGKTLRGRFVSTVLPSRLQEADRIVYEAAADDRVTYPLDHFLLARGAGEVALAGRPSGRARRRGPVGAIQVVASLVVIAKPRS